MDQITNTLCRFGTEQFIGYYMELKLIERRVRSGLSLLSSPAAMATLNTSKQDNEVHNNDEGCNSGIHYNGEGYGTVIRDKDEGSGTVIHTKMKVVVQ